MSLIEIFFDILNRFGKKCFMIGIVISLVLLLYSVGEIIEPVIPKSEYWIWQGASIIMMIGMYWFIIDYIFLVKRKGDEE